MDNTSSKSRLGQRKFSGAMSRISSSTFSRRRNTTTTLPSSVSSIQLNHQSRLPTPSGIPKSTSFLCSLNHFNHPSIDENQPPQPTNQHRLPERSSPGPSSSSRRVSQIPRAASRSGPKPDCSVKIEQRGLMQPMQPPLPRSSTMNHLSSSQSLGVLQENTNTGGTNADRDMRRQSIVLNKRNHTLTPPTRLVKLQKTPSGPFPKRKDSLMAPPATAITPVQYAAVSEAVAPQRAVSYDEEDTVIISRDFAAPRSPPKVQTRMTVRNISHFQEELGETEKTDHHHTSTENATPRLRSAHDNSSPSPLLAPTANDQDDDPRFVYSAQQPTYWLGRYTALSDIFHTSALPEPIPTTHRGDKAARMPNPFPSSSFSNDALSGGKHPMQDRTTRLKHVYMQLRLSCVTEDAIQSFQLFEEMMEEVMEEPVKKAPRVSAGVKEKKGWLEGLMARRKSSNVK